MSELHVYRIDDGDQHWYIATSARKALAAHAKSMTLTVAQHRREYPETTVNQVPDSHMLPINQENPNGSFTAVRHRCSTWAKQGAGFLCTTNY